MKTPLTCLSIFIVLCGCSNKPGIYKDESFTTETYLEKGCPSTDKDWNNDDFQSLLDCLLKIKAENKFFLPRKNSPRSGDYFSKMVDENHFSFIVDTTISNVLKIQPMNELLEYYIALLYLYQEEKEFFQGFSNELTSIDIFSTRMSMANLQNMERIDKQNEILFNAFEGNLSGLAVQKTKIAEGKKKFISGIAISVKADLGKVEEAYSAYERADMILLTKETISLIQAAWEYFSEDQKSKITALMEKIEKNHPYDEIRMVVRDALKKI
jgi:hypothetical protein